MNPIFFLSCAFVHSLPISMCACVLWTIQFIEQMKIKRTKKKRMIHTLTSARCFEIYWKRVYCVFVIFYWSIIPQLQTIMSTSDHHPHHNHHSRSIDQINRSLTMKWILFSTYLFFDFIRSIDLNIMVTKKWWAGNSSMNKKRPIISFQKELETVSVLTRCNVSGQYNDQDVNIRIMSTNNMFNQQDWLGNSSS